MSTRTRSRRGHRPAPRRGRPRAGAVVVTVLAALMACAGCGGGAGSTPAGGVAYAALGDSSSSGAGIAPIVQQSCQRSKVDFGALVAAKLRYPSFKDRSCAGAMTTNLQSPQLGAAINDPQLDAVGSRTRLVTLTIGLNDGKVAYGLLSACLSPDGTPSALCRQVLDMSPATLEAQLSAGAQRVQDALRLIRKSAPSARVVLVGYPRFFPDTGTCPDRVPMVPQMVPTVVSAFKRIDRLWRKAAAEAGADYVDTWRMSKGHDVCSDDPWVNGATPVPGKAAALHPFAAFHRAVAAAIVKLVQTPPAS